jgi:hypothetical protein
LRDCKRLALGDRVEVVLVTLGGCHLLNGLVELSPLKHARSLTVTPDKAL